MQRAMWDDVNVQGELGERAAVRPMRVPRAVPTADAELAECFVRAAIAWAKWRERRAWQGR